jgi:hypothetical protein
MAAPNPVSRFSPSGPINKDGSGGLQTTSNQGGGEELVLPLVGTDAPFRTLVGGTNVSISESGDTLIIAATPGGPIGSSTVLNQSLVNGANVSEALNTLAAVDDALAGDILANTNNITILANDVITNANNIIALQADKLETTSNSGGGEPLALAKVGTDAPFKTLIAGAGVTLTPAAESLTIAAVGGGGGVTNMQGAYDGAPGIIGNDNMVWNLTADWSVTADNFSMTCATNGGVLTLQGLTAVLNGSNSVTIHSALGNTGLTGETISIVSNDTLQLGRLGQLASWPPSNDIGVLTNATGDGTLTWVPGSSFGNPPYQIINFNSNQAPTQTQLQDHEITYVGNTGPGPEGSDAPITFTLPSNGQEPKAGDRVLVKDGFGNAGINNITVTTAAAGKIDGQDDYFLAIAYGSVTFQSLGPGNGYMVI